MNQCCCTSLQKIDQIYSFIAQFIQTKVMQRCFITADVSEG